MSVTIRSATEADFKTIHKLIVDLAEFNDDRDKVTNTLQRMKQEQDYFGAFVATLETGEIIGMAIYFYAYFTWSGKSLYLDDLFVNESYRQQGIGKKLVKEVMQVAKKEKCARVQWQTRNWNKNAASFYKSIGGKITDDSLDIKFEGSAIDEALEKLSK